MVSVVLGEVTPSPPPPPPNLPSLSSKSPTSHVPFWSQANWDGRSSYILSPFLSRILWSFFCSCLSVWLHHSVCLSPTHPCSPGIPPSFPPDSPPPTLWQEKHCICVSREGWAAKSRDKRPGGMRGGQGRSLCLGGGRGLAGGGEGPTSSSPPERLSKYSRFCT